MHSNISELLKLRDNVMGWARKISSAFSLSAYYEDDPEATCSDFGTKLKKWNKDHAVCMAVELLLHYTT